MHPGNLVKLRRMMQISQARKDVMGQFQNSLYLGDAEERVRLLQEVGKCIESYYNLFENDINSSNYYG